MASTELIDGIVRQTTILIAHLATASGQRTHLANVANQVFEDLVRELRQQGVGNKVIADMFGLALRTYHNKVARSAESRTERGTSLWEAVLDYVREHSGVSRPELLNRFERDDGAVVRGVLRDLVDNSLIYATGSGDGTRYRHTEAGDMRSNAEEPEAALANLVLVAIHQAGSVHREQLAELTRIDEDALQGALEQLVSSDRAQVEEVEGQVYYSCARILIPYHDAAGWEAAVLDHYQAMVTSICTKLGSGDVHADAEDQVGGSTYTYDIWKGHPLEGEVVGLLSSLRRQAVDLRQRVEAGKRSTPGAGRCVPAQSD